MQTHQIWEEYFWWKKWYLNISSLVDNMCNGYVFVKKKKILHPCRLLIGFIISAHMWNLDFYRTQNIKRVSESLTFSNLLIYISVWRCFLFMYKYGKVKKPDMLTFKCGSEIDISLSVTMKMLLSNLSELWRQPFIFTFFFISILCFHNDPYCRFNVSIVRLSSI